MSLQVLKQLRALVNDSLDVLEFRFSDEQFPSLDEPFDFNAKSSAILHEPEMATASTTLVAAASHLIALVGHPVKTTMDFAMGFHVSSCMRAVIETNTVEIIRESGSTGIHVRDIARRNGCDESKLSRVLRLLAANHIFRETSPDTFVNNRLSSILDTGKMSEAIITNPESKYEHTSGLTALVIAGVRDGLQSSAYLTETLAHPTYAHGVQANEAPFNVALQTKESYFEWLARPGNELNQTRFNVSMSGTAGMQSPELMFGGFDWASLPDGSRVVDVGGGLGESSSILLSRSFPRLKFVVQDLSGIVIKAKKNWEVLKQGAGDVTFEVHNFFDPQPIPGAAVYILRIVLHDWADPQAITILKHLRQAAAPSTKLLLVEAIVDYSFDLKPYIPERIVGASLPPASPPLLAHVSNKANNWLDLQMLCLMNGKERTVKQLDDLAFQCGWKLTSVRRFPGAMYSQIIAETI